MSSIEESRAGAFVLQAEGRLIRLVWTGGAELDAIEGLIECARATSERIGGPLRQLRLLVLAHDATGLSGPGRRALMGFKNNNPWERVAVVGLRYEIKIVIEMVHRVFALLPVEQAELKFLDSETEARAWLDEA